MFRSYLRHLTQAFRAGSNTRANVGVRRAATVGRSSYDVVVLGTGAFGSAAAYHLAKQGASVLAIDQFSPAHSYGSSHGHTRIIRLAYHEGLEYHKLLRRSYDLFLDLQAETRQELFYRTGMLDVGATFENALKGAQMYKLDYEVLTGAQVNSRFPGYSVPEDMPALYQPDGGILTPEAIIQAHCALAQQHGAHMLYGEKVQSWSAGPGGTGGVEVQTASGTTFRAQQLIVSAGAWMSTLVPETKGLCVPVRQVVAWFDCPPNQFHKDSFPVFIVGDDIVNDCFYGFPQYGAQPGFKIGKYNHLFEVVDPTTINRTMTPEDDCALRSGVQKYFKSADGKVLHYGVCMFTNTPDNHFIIDRHPRHPQVILCSACSGHGFKMSSGIGQLLANMVVHGGAGSSEVQEELAIHRLSAQRSGHSEFLEACARS